MRGDVGELVERRSGLSWRKNEEEDEVREKEPSSAEA